MVGAEQQVLGKLSTSIETRLQEWAHPGARLHLEWTCDLEKSVSVQTPVARVQVGEGDFIGEIARMGHGLQRSFLVSLLQELAEGGEGGQPTLILGFEEPELYQHPPQARHLVHVLEELSSRNAQVLVTTHSPYFVSGRGFESVRMAHRPHGESATTVSHVTHQQISDTLALALGGVPRSPSAVMAAVEQIMQPSQNELFFTRVPILVEGVEDIAYVSTYLKLTGRWREFRRLGCHFIVADGKTNMSRPLAIANALGIPAFVVFDGDGDKEERAQRRDNSCLLCLCGEAEADTYPKQTQWGSRNVMWATNIGGAVRGEVGQGKWDEAQERARAELGLQEGGIGGKNTLLLGATLETLVNQGIAISVLERLSDSILCYANETVVQ